MNLTDAPIRVERGGKRDQILDETLKIVAERGYNGFGIQELATRCGLTKPGLLHHFGSKDQLLVTLLNEVDAKEEAEVSALFADEMRKASDASTARGLFQRSLRIIAARSFARPELTRLQVVLRAEALYPEHPAHAYFAQRHKARLERMTKGVALFSPSPEPIARQVLAMLSGLEEQWLREDAQFDFLAECERFFELLLP